MTMTAMVAPTVIDCEVEPDLASLAMTTSDGGRIAFGGGSALLVKDLFTGVTTQVASANIHTSFLVPVFSPDGTKIAFLTDAALDPNDSVGVLDQQQGAVLEVECR